MFKKRSLKVAMLVGLVVFTGLLVLNVLAATPGSQATVVTASDECQTFETGYKVCGRFLDYWRKNGGTAQQGLPISAVFDEKNAPLPLGDGQVHKVQYFERARFEEHLENAAPNDVLLGLLGAEQYRVKYGERDPNSQFILIRGRRNETKINQFEARQGYTFVVIDLLVTNRTDNKVLVSPESISVRTAQIYDYKIVEATYALPKALKLTELKINDRVGGELVFEVPVAEALKSLTIDYFDDKATVAIP